MFDMGMMEEMMNAAEMPQRGGVRGNRFLATANLFTYTNTLLSPMSIAFAILIYHSMNREGDVGYNCL